MLLALESYHILRSEKTSVHYCKFSCTFTTGQNVHEFQINCHATVCTNSSFFCPCPHSQLRDAYIFQLTQGYSHYDRQLRNDLLVIASLVASICPQAPFIETGFAKQLVLFATFQEGKNVSFFSYYPYIEFVQNLLLRK